MALTVLPTSSLPRDPSWDEAIVPALRKRLEHESQALSKRMSAASMSSVHEEYSADTFASNSAYTARNDSIPPNPQFTKPSAIPRPSLQHSRTSETSDASSTPRPGSMKRTRTFSQPFPFDPSSSRGTSHSTADNYQRANSPMASTVKSTRIPVSRSRTGSTSSYRQPSFNGVLANGRAESRNGGYRSNGVALQPHTPDMRSLNEGQFSSVSSRSTMKTPRSTGTDLANEPAPFSAASSRYGYDDDLSMPRRSSESEERPFEHWYRGDVSRNGGVGELRVARKQEMLDIAYYGHTLRNASSNTALDTPARSRSNSRGHESSPYTSVNGRPRSGSMGLPPGRASIYIDSQAIPEGVMVFDERPPTELDSEEEEPYEDSEGYMREDVTERYQLDQGPSPPLLADRSDTPTTLVDGGKNSTFKSRIPTPTSRQMSDPPEIPTPTQSPAIHATANVPPLPIQNSQSVSATPTPTPKASPASAAKQRAKSPAAAKTKSKSPAKPPLKKQRDNEDRRSVAQYPEVDGEDIAHAIPTWTQPVPPSGNWDDVVLPAVARKRGLEGQYVRADGSPRPKRSSKVIEPAPGTFGYDHSKYRPVRTSNGPEDIPMDEFGQRIDDIETVSEEPEQNYTEKQPQPTSPLAPPQVAPRGRSPVRAESPAPFSHYTNAPEPVPQIRVTRPSTETQKLESDGEEDSGSGCCKCVVM